VSIRFCNCDIFQVWLSSKLAEQVAHESLHSKYSSVIVLILQYSEKNEASSLRFFHFVALALVKGLLFHQSVKGEGK
jgi:hypothetical protein